MAGIFVKSTLALSVSLALGSVAQAAYLGQLKVQSAPAQNFVATVQVHDVDSTAKSLLAKLAPKATYDQFKVTMPRSAQGLSMALVSKNPLTLKISGKQPAQEQAFPLLLELHEGDQIKVRQYNIRLGATGSVEPTAPVVKVASSASTAPVAKAEPVAQKAAPVKAAVAKPAKSEKTMTPLERMKAKGYDLSKPITIEEGYTPWSLGVLYQSRYPGATVNQVLVALAVHNAEAFPNGNVRQLKTGAKLSAPPASLVQSINRQTAHEIVQKGLNIQEVAQRPMPIETAKPVAKKVVKPAPVVAPMPAPVVDAVKPAEPVVEKVEPKVEEKPAEAPVAVPQEPAATAEVTAAQPVAEAAPAPVPAPAPEPVASEPAPTLEIMTEEEVKPEEESSSWYWWVLLVVLLGAGGFVFWRTKQGKKVDFESLKKAMQEKGMPRKEPVVARPEQKTVVTSATAVAMKPVEEAPVVQEEPTFLQPTPQPAPKAEPVVAPKPVEMPKMPTQDDSFNVFDLVSEDATVTTKEPAKPATPVAKPTVVETKVEPYMNDTLEMARSFIAINSHNEAIMLLQEVLQSGTPAERQTAQTLLDQIRQQH